MHFWRVTALLSCALLLPRGPLPVAAATGPPTVEIAPGVHMPMVSLGHPDGPGRGGNATINETAALELWLGPRVNGTGIDTALDYLNQAQVGAAMRASGRARGSMFLTTKIPNVLSRAEMVAYVKKDIEQLGETPDLVLIHSPCSSGFASHGCTLATSEEIAEAWLGMEDALKAGLTRAIGVSNFAIEHLHPIIDLGGTVPALNQCEMYVGSYDEDTANFCKSHGITYESYSPLGRGLIDFKDPRIQRIAEAHGKSVYQVCLRWVVQLGSPMAVSSTTLSHDLSDLDIFGFDLTSAEMADLSAMSLKKTAAPSVEIAPGVHMPMISLGHPDGASRGGNATANETAALELWLSSQVNGSGIDTARSYANQAQVGAAMRASGRERGSLFLTTKIHNVFSRAKTLDSVKEDIALLGETPDLVLIHSPCYSGFPSMGCKHASAADIQQAWLGMQDALKAGLTRAIGVSNFLEKDLQPILDLGGTAPAVNQCEMYVGAHDDATRAFCNSHGITYESYSPLGRGRLDFKDPRIQRIAEAHGKSAYQVCLRWVVQLGSPMALSSTKLAHDLEDMSIFGFALSAAEMATLSSI